MANALEALGALAEAQQRRDEDIEIRQASWPDPLAEEAFHGLAGDMVRTIEPHTEADPAALLVQFLVAFGNVIGPGPHFTAEADRHGTNLNAVLVGTTAKGRKGTSWGHILRVFESVEPAWVKEHIASGLSSGEGLIYAVRDADSKEDGDPGVADKRLLVQESEFASTLRVLARDGNTLSSIIRNAWDSGSLRTLVKNNPAKATGAHISIVGHITKDELLRYLGNTEAANGFANRFLWVCVKRSKILPDGGNIAQVNFQPLISTLNRTVTFAKNTSELKRDQEASELWYAVYPKLSDGHPGLLGAVTARAEAQVMRLALLYALLDTSKTIRREHLEAALAVWEYCEASAKFIFGDELGDPVADTILEALREAPEGLTRTDISNLFQRNQSAKRIGRALGDLLGANLAKMQEEDSTEGGRPPQRWFAT